MQKSVSTSVKKPATATSQEKADLVVKYADDMKALDIEVLDVRRKTSATEFFVVCTGTSDVHLRAVAEKVADNLRNVDGIKPLRKSDRGGEGWILVDYGDVVLHVMSEEKRQFYDLESLWSNIQPDPNLPVE